MKSEHLYLRLKTQKLIMIPLFIISAVRLSLPHVLPGESRRTTTWYNWLGRAGVQRTLQERISHPAFIVLPLGCVHTDGATSWPAPLADQQSTQIHVAWRVLMHPPSRWGGLLNVPLQVRTLSSCPPLNHTRRRQHTNARAAFARIERVRLAAKAGLARGLMMPGMRLLSTTAG